MLETGRRVSAFILSFLILTMPAVGAYAAAPQNNGVTHPAHTSGGGAYPQRQTSLDLTSTVQNVMAPRFVQNVPTTITVGGNHLLVTPSTMLTAAERLAAIQMLRTGHQSLIIGSMGNAVGGTFTLGSKLSQTLTSLIIPQGVSAIRNFATAGNLNLAGNLTNAGTIYAVSTNPTITNASISAANIVNQAGAVITTVLPPTALAGVSGAVSRLDLSLSAVQNIINAGTISSSRTLNLNAGGSIVNAMASGVSGSTPALFAQSGINIFTGSGNITNAGLIAAASGNINIASILSSNIAINNLGGTIQALAGAINIRDSSYASQANLSINGGNL